MQSTLKMDNTGTPRQGLAVSAPLFDHGFVVSCYLLNQFLAHFLTSDLPIGTECSLCPQSVDY